jgi:FtsP/CotA-like multicopper oxidase with cupredoxin domain
MSKPLTRRALLGGCLSATLWSSWRSPSLASETPDGFRLIEAGQISTQLAPGHAATQALGYGGATPGPLLRVKLGETLKVRLINRLAEPTTLNWRGLRIANAMAGIGDLTQKPVEPGASYDYIVAPPDVGFAWYGPHAGVASANQISCGLFGPVIIDEPSPPVVDLDTVVAVQDWRLGADGQVDPTAPKPDTGRIGDFLTANGAPAPLTLLPAPGARVRLRLLNAAAARIMILAVEGVKPTIVAIDSQPSEPFEPLRNLMPIGPGARFELIFDMPAEPDARVQFTLRGGEAAPTPQEPDRPLVVFKATGAALKSRPPFAGLPANPLLPKEINLAQSTRGDFVLSGGPRFEVNGVALSAPWPERPLLRARKGAPVTFALINKTSSPQALRWGGHVARLLHALDDGWEPYWRDSVLLAPGQTAHVAFVADNPGRWPIESAILDCQAAGGRSFFEVF